MSECAVTVNTAKKCLSAVLTLNIFSSDSLKMCVREKREEKAFPLAKIQPGNLPETKAFLSFVDVRRLRQIHFRAYPKFFQ